MVKREMYLKRIRPFYELEEIKVIMGVRRCGKSTLLRQIKEEIIDSGVDPARIIEISFENYKYRNLKNPDLFYEYIESRIIDNEKYYLLFDEIQNVNDFELVVNSFRATYNVSIFLTGSNSKLLSGELATHLGGRTVSFTIMPFTFKEYCEYLGVNEGSKELFINYIHWGGFPMVMDAKDEETKYLILSNLYDSIVLKDIIMRNKISNVHVLEKLIEYVIANSSCVISGKSVVASFSEDGVDVSVPTIYDYLRYMEESCVVRKVSRYDIRGKKVLSFEEKYYVCDLGLLSLKKNRIKDEYNLVIETVIYNELISRGYHVYIGKTYKGEVDFIATKNNKKIYIQATYLLSDEAVIDREFNAFKDINDNYPKYVISYDDWTSDRDGIHHINIIDFLMGEDLV